MRKFEAYVKYQNGIEGEFEFKVADDATKYDIEDAAEEAALKIFDMWWEEKESDEE